MAKAFVSIHSRMRELNEEETEKNIIIIPTII